MKLTDEVRRAIAADISRGETTAQIAEKYGVHVQTIYYAKKQGLIPRNTRTLTAAEKAEIEILLYQLPTIAAVARAAKRHRHTIEKIAKNFNAKEFGWWPERRRAEGFREMEAKKRILRDRWK